jgi:hypothetical protein
MTRTDALTVLGVDDAADLDQIKSAWRHAALTAHPDQGGDSERFILLHTAYQILTGAQEPTAPETIASETTGDDQTPVVTDDVVVAQEVDEVVVVTVADAFPVAPDVVRDLVAELVSDGRTRWLFSRRVAVIGALAMIVRYWLPAVTQLRTGVVYQTYQNYYWYPVGGRFAEGLATFFGLPTLGVALGVALLAWMFSPALRSVRYDRWRAGQNLRLADAPPWSIVAGRVALALPVLSALLLVLSLVLWLLVIAAAGVVILVVLSAFFGGRN